ncbi:MAG: sialidase family protein [Pseudomonadota bacterium]
MGHLQRFCILAAAVLFSSTVFAAPHSHGEATSACADRETPASLDCALAPTGTFDEQGRLWLVWAFGGHVYVQHSEDRGETFSSPVLVNRTPERVAADGENRPKIAIGPEGTVFVSWVERLEAPYTGDVRFARSTDGGETFSEPLTVNDNRDLTSHRFESIAVNERGELFIAWLDKRDRVAAEQEDESYNGAALYYTISRDGGESFEPDRKVVDHTCECCRTAMALDEQGLPVVVWRHIYGDNIRDHGLVRFEDSTTPAEPIRLSHDQWQVDACPHHGPDISVDGGIWHTVWFNNGPERHGLFYARSTDGGEGFSTPMAVGEYEAAPSHPAVLGIAERAWLAWMEFDGEKTQLLVQRSDDGGVSWSEPDVVASTAGEADHPRLVRHRNEAFVSWQTARDGFHFLTVGAE